MRILGIETSCDETGVAIYDANHGLIAHALHSQSSHIKYGGVVPELASRDHLRYIVSLVDEAYRQAQIKTSDIDAVAYTAGPGLIGSLLTGACFAKSFAWSLHKPSLAIHHLEAHLLAAKLEFPTLQFPFLALLISGGHTQLIVAHALGKYQILGDTLDDAVGEAFDKTAKLIGIPYPGGATLAKMADNFPENLETPQFPRPLLKQPNLNFSFSGLKTHAAVSWQNSNKDDNAKNMIAKGLQDSIIDILIAKCHRAMLATQNYKLVIAGGVAANISLRKALTKLMQDLGGEFFYPSLEYCTDNGAMIAYAGYLYFLNSQQDPDLAIKVHARWPLEVYNKE